MRNVLLCDNWAALTRQTTSLTISCTSLCTSNVNTSISKLVFLILLHTFTIRAKIPNLVWKSSAKEPLSCTDSTRGPPCQCWRRLGPAETQMGRGTGCMWCGGGVRLCLGFCKAFGEVVTKAMWTPFTYWCFAWLLVAETMAKGNRVLSILPRYDCLLYMVRHI